jgi:Tol biopolymer transport system component
MPDGKLMVNKNEGNQVNFWLMDEDGRNQTLLTSDGGINLYPVLTPDGRYIVFTSNRKGNYHLWRIDADGRNPVQLTDSPNEIDLLPEILEDGKTIIFERRPEDRIKSKLMKTTIDGGPAEMVFPESPTYDGSPSLSRDGKLLAYTAHSFESKNLIFKSVLKISAIEGGIFKPATKELNRDFGWNYQWAGDNKKLIFINKEGVPNIFQTGLDDGQPKPLTAYNSGTIINFNLSRDGKKLFLVRGIVNSDLILIKNNEKAS